VVGPQNVCKKSSTREYGVTGSIATKRGLSPSLRARELARPLRLGNTFPSAVFEVMDDEHVEIGVGRVLICVRATRR
jgi:hypothetical protein